MLAASPLIRKSCVRMMRRSLIIVMAACAASAASDPAVDAPFAAARQTLGIPGTKSAVLTTDVYFPGTPAPGVDPAARPCPVIVLGHGFSQSSRQHVNQGLQLATRGYIVLIPAFNGVPTTPETGSISASVSIGSWHGMKIRPPFSSGRCARKPWVPRALSRRIKRHPDGGQRSAHPGVVVDGSGGQWRTGRGRAGGGDCAGGHHLVRAFGLQFKWERRRALRGGPRACAGA
jgi:hypothetical protein